MSAKPNTERDLLVFSIWAVLGFGGLAFLLEGFKRNSYLITLLGTAFIVAGFVAHIIVNGLYQQGFRSGETALGIGLFGVLTFTFIAGVFSGGMSMVDYYSGLTLFAVLVVGFIAYLSTRHGLRGAFSRFHVKTSVSGDGSR
ncbi:hypothetical protein OEG84_13060 [Hoeflea sp. G2-23]|uniref:Uncharacterized protein n=1 Tax=Hoeflea algicola TaxID=2983763 RepID=A0ABT3Z9Z6_9HYPH|nr:hypothetical protein [Hoeflea algicola]MCY0148610.1 hypothetical protein [Hoeflea algicola]